MPTSLLRVVCPLLLALALGACGFFAEPPPSDAELVEAFQSQRDRFEALAADTAGATLPDRPPTLERRTTPSGLRLIAWSRDLVGVGGCFKGYALPGEAPATVVESLDRYRDCPPVEVDAYVALDGGWYLFFSSSN